MPICATATAAILAASGQLERWDGRSDPGAEGIYTWPAIDCKPKAGKVIATIAASVARILALGKMPVVLGGEHTVTGGVIRGYLDAGVRGAISTFSKIGDVDAGLARLRGDLGDGTWERRHGHLRRQSELDLGYRLVVARRGDEAER